jgi:hypothetical protein
MVKCFLCCKSGAVMRQGLHYLQAVLRVKSVTLKKGVCQLLRPAEGS